MSYKNMTAKEYQRKWRKKNRVKLREYQRQYKRKRRSDSTFRHEEVSRILAWQRKRRAENREKWNADRRRWKAQKLERTRMRLGKKCRFSGCRRKDRLFVHHNHQLQQQLKCCRSLNGCERCQVCMLCSTHNHMLAMVGDRLSMAKKVVAFLRRYH